MANLKIITSNIRFANNGDGIHDWAVRLPLLSDIYQNFGPDLLGTQEGREGQLRELDNRLPTLQLVESHRSWIEDRMYPCLFINPKTIIVEGSGDIWLSETPNIPASSSFLSSFPRLCTWAEITIKSSGLKLMIINTHLDHVLATTREQQIQVLITEVKKITQRPVIILGDFNESPLTTIQEKLKLAFDLKDPWIEKKYPEETSHHGFLGEQVEKGDRIDWILMPNNFICTDLLFDKRAFLDGVYPSDHYPLLATVIPK